MPEGYKYGVTDRVLMLLSDSGERSVRTFLTEVLCDIECVTYIDAIDRFQARGWLLDEVAAVLARISHNLPQVYSGPKADPHGIRLVFEAAGVPVPARYDVKNDVLRALERSDRIPRLCNAKWLFKIYRNGSIDERDLTHALAANVAIPEDRAAMKVAIEPAIGKDGRKLDKGLLAICVAKQSLRALDLLTYREPTLSSVVDPIITRLRQRTRQAQVCEIEAAAEARKKTEEEDRKREEGRRRLAEERRNAEEARRRAEDETRRAQEEIRKAEEAARVKAETDRKAEEARRAEAARLAEIERKRAEEEAVFEAQHAAEREAAAAEAARVAEEAARRRATEAAQAAEGARVRAEEEARLSAEASTAEAIDRTPMERAHAGRSAAAEQKRAERLAALPAVEARLLGNQLARKREQERIRHARQKEERQHAAVDMVVPPHYFAFYQALCLAQTVLEKMKWPGALLTGAIVNAVYDAAREANAHIIGERTTEAWRASERFKQYRMLESIGRASRYVHVWRRRDGTYVSDPDYSPPTLLSERRVRMILKDLYPTPEEFARAKYDVRHVQLPATELSKNKRQDEDQAVVPVVEDVSQPQVEELKNALAQAGLMVVIAIEASKNEKRRADVAEEKLREADRKIQWLEVELATRRQSEATDVIERPEDPAAQQSTVGVADDPEDSGETTKPDAFKEDVEFKEATVGEEEGADEIAGGDVIHASGTGPRIFVSQLTVVAYDGLSRLLVMLQRMFDYKDRVLPNRVACLVSARVWPNNPQHNVPLNGMLRCRALERPMVGYWRVPEVEVIDGGRGQKEMGQFSDADLEDIVHMIRQDARNLAFFEQGQPVG